ncbi:MAG: extracellular solute-binding protein [Eubacteriales bacterium]|nr:extracellular solute-binding protein [Eubacteriales bacterium]
MKTKKLLSLGLAAAMALSMPLAVKAEDTNILDVTLGEDYTDLKADLKFVTHRTDLVDTVFADYIAQFQEMYPNINITYEGITNYADDIMTRMSTGDWGDIGMIPTAIDKDELPSYFEPFGEKEALEEKYTMLNNFTYEGVTYGLPSVGNAQGIVYNKKVFEEAGITELPKTPDEFLDALQAIKDNTDAIPLYTNFAAGWTMSAWDAYIGGSATGDPDFMNTGMVHGDNPFAKKDDMTGPYAVYYVLYEAVARGLTEDDPTTTDWEGSKGMINGGEIGTMVLGSWAVTQMQEAGPNPDDIGYMTFPITVDGKQYATAGPDYNYGINVNSSDENKLAAKLYIKFLMEESNFAFDQGGIPTVVGAEYPDIYSAFDGIELVVDNPALEGEENLYTEINNDSEIGLNVSPDDKSLIVEEAISGGMSLDDIMADWNERWTSAQENAGVK